MFPAPEIKGHVVAGWVPWKQLRLACHPPGLFDRLRALPGFDQRELAMDIKLEERATEGCANPDEYAPWIELHIRREQHWFEILRHLVERLPVMVTPRWVSTRSQPIAIDDVLDYLVAALERRDLAGNTYDIGGADTVTYRELMQIVVPRGKAEALSPSYAHSTNAPSTGHRAARAGAGRRSWPR